MNIEEEQSELNEMIKGADISDEEEEYLLALNKAATKMKYDLLEDQEVNISKEASNTKYASYVKKQLGRVGDFLGDNKNEIMTGAAILPVAAMGGKYLYDGARKMADPLVENYRYRRMRDLPGKRVHERIDPQSRELIADGFYIPEEQDGKPLSQDERSEQAVRKAFEMMHQRNPDMTKNPILAKSFMENRLNERVDQFADRVTQRGISDEQLMEAQRKRKNEDRFVDDVGRTVNMVDDATSVRSKVIPNR